jgi:HD superfamily phosphohydrolase YqeK
MGNVEIINVAKEYLKVRPIDAAHGVDHHEAVAGNCVNIIQAERLAVDADIVVVAAWWHDLESQQGATDLLRREMTAAGFDEREYEAVSAIIHAHTYGKRQKTIEAKILFDADKMEYFNPQRMRQAVEDARGGLLPIPTLAKHYHDWLKRHQRVLESLHFRYSRTIASQNMVPTMAEIAKMGMFLDSKGFQ